MCTSAAKKERDWKSEKEGKQEEEEASTHPPLSLSLHQRKSWKMKNEKTKKKNYSSHRISNKKIHPFSYFFPPFPLPSSLTTVTSRYFSISQMKKKPPKSHSLSLSLSLCLFLMIKTQPPAPSFVFLKMEEIFRPFAHPSTHLPIYPSHLLYKISVHSLPSLLPSISSDFFLISLFTLHPSPFTVHRSPFIYGSFMIYLNKPSLLTQHPLRTHVLPMVIKKKEH